VERTAGAPAPHADLDPRPPPPDWTVEDVRPREVPPLPSWQRVFEVDTRCPTLIATLPVTPVRLPRASRQAPILASPPRRRRLAAAAIAIALVSLALAGWQSYWLLRSTETGRTLLDGLATGIAQLTQGL
jgi:hypothetical protein